MITEIKRKDLDSMAIFPDIKIDVVKDPWENSKIYIETMVEIDNYLNHLVKQYEFKSKLNYKTLSEFITSLKSDVRRLIKTFDLETYTDNEYFQIYKIVE